MMQFQLDANLIGLKRSTIDGRSFVSLYIAEDYTDEQKANGCSGLSVRKVTADDAVVSQLPKDYKTLSTIKFLAVLKDAAGGKAQPHIVGVVPAQGKAS